MGRRTRTLLPTSARLLKPKLPKPAKELVTKKREKQADYYNRGAKRLKELKPGDIIRMKPDPKDRKKLWKKATCLQEVAPRSYEVDIEGKRYRRNRKDLIATRESPAIDSHVGEPNEPPLSDDQSQRVVDPVQLNLYLTRLYLRTQPQNDERPLKGLQRSHSQLKEDPPEGA